MSSRPTNRHRATERPQLPTDLVDRLVEAVIARLGSELLDRMAASSHATSNQSILRRPEVLARTGLSRSTLYNKIKAGTFPKPIPMSANMVGWYCSDIDRWIADPR